MRPRTLRLQAFGPFADEVTIDFDEIGAHGLYLVTGETGAGKTTIFDAISFALFGLATGNLREAKTMRSHFAQPETRAEVELTFTYRGETYVILRRPDQYRRSVRRRGGVYPMVHDDPYAELRHSHTTIVGTAAVNSAVVEILGLDKRQFDSIVMIAQGEFRKVFNANTEERRQILSKLFGTSAYESFAQKLLRERNLLRDRLEVSEREAKAHGSHAMFELASEREKRYEKLMGADFFQANELQSLVGEQLEADRPALAKEQERLDRIAKESEALKLKESRLEERNRAEKRVEQVKQQVESLKSECASRRADLALVKEKTPYQEELLRRIHGIEASLGTYEELDDARRARALAEKENAAWERAEASLREAQTSAQKLEGELAKLSGADVAAEKASQERSWEEREMDRLAKAASELTRRASAVTEASRAFEVAARTFNERQKGASRASEEVARLRALFLAGQAAYLAERLVEGEPCPVCGSKEHPLPALRSHGVPTEDEVDAAERRESDARAKASDAYGAAEAAKAALAEKRAELSRAEEIHGLPESIAIALDEARRRVSEAKSKEKTALDRAQILKETQERSATLASELVRLRREAEALAEAPAKASAAKASYEMLAQGLAYADLISAKKALDCARKEARAIQAREQAASEALARSERDLARAQAQLQEMESRLEEMPKEDAARLAQTRRSLETKRAEVSSARDVLMGRVEINDKLRIDLAKSVRELESLRARFAIVNPLALTAMGRLGSGKARVSFETFVLRRYFELVVLAANQRLSTLTERRYELRLKEAGTSGNAQTGLDLEVFDHFSGQGRDVSTLSGGESFQAALSLALGLSDVVQRQSGGISLDTMFVDEGFGSLDAEALQQAVKMLQEQTGDGKVVGVISHVEALASAIEAKVVVHRGQQGSTLEVRA